MKAPMPRSCHLCCATETRSKDAKFGKLRKGLVSAGLVQMCQDCQVVFGGDEAANI